MKGIRSNVARALDALGVKRPVKAGLNLILETTGLPAIGRPRVFRDLDRLARGPRPRPAAGVGRLLVFTMRGWTTHVALETLLGEAAAQRGLQPTFFTCGGPLPLCGITTFRAPDPTPCRDCHGYVARYLDTLGFETLTLGELVNEGERAALGGLVDALADDALDSFVHEGLELGSMIQTSVKWFLLRGSAEASERWVRTQRGFLKAALTVQVAVDRLLDRCRPDRVLCLSGLFFAERVLLAAAVRRGIPVTTYERGFMPGTWVFRHDAVASEYRIAADFERLADRRLRPDEARRLEDYLGARIRGGTDADKYWPRMEAARDAIVSELQLDPDRPIVTAFSNITWDSAIQDRDVAFADMFDWMQRTVEHFTRDDRVQLVLRVHPAEVRLVGRETTEGVIETLSQRLGGLPPRLRIVPATSGLSSYTLARMSRFSIVYTSTIGLELACAGLPVVVAADTHYRGLGFTCDVECREHYGELLERLLEHAPAPDAARARAYANFFFFRFMIPLGCVEEDADHDVRIPLESLAELGPGRDPALDAVLDGLVTGRPILHVPTDEG